MFLLTSEEGLYSVDFVRLHLIGCLTFLKEKKEFNLNLARCVYTLLYHIVSPSSFIYRAHSTIVLLFYRARWFLLKDLELDSKLIAASPKSVYMVL